MTTKIKMKDYNEEVCNCDQDCLGKICVSSDSGLTVKKCWCPECKQRRVEVKKNSGVILSWTRY
jgi:Zn finger protein HypA/HybF involved in hydrogenase expression